MSQVKHSGLRSWKAEQAVKQGREGVAFGVKGRGGKAKVGGLLSQIALQLATEPLVRQQINIKRDDEWRLSATFLSSTPISLSLSFSALSPTPFDIRPRDITEAYLYHALRFTL